MAISPNQAVPGKTKPAAVRGDAHPISPSGGTDRREEREGHTPQNFACAPGPDEQPWSCQQRCGSEPGDDSIKNGCARPEKISHCRNDRPACTGVIANCRFVGVKPGALAHRECRHCDPGGNAGWIPR